MQLRVFIFILFQNFVFLAKGQQQIYRHFTVEDGLPSLSIHQVQQDDKGYIWLATDKGVGKYDGYHFTTYTVQDGLPTNDIHSLFIDSQGRIWLIGEMTFFAYIDKGKVHAIPIEDTKKLFSVYPRGIHEHDNTIWIDTDAGLFSYKKNKLSTFAYPQKELEFLGLDKKGVKWFYDENAVLYPEANRTKGKKIPLGPEEYLDSRMFYWDAETIYFETSDNLYFFKDTLTSINLFSSLSIGEQQFPYLVSRRNIKRFNAKKQLETEYIHHGEFKLEGAFKDNEDNWWFGTQGDGLYLLTANAKHTTTFNIENGLDDPVVTAVTKDKNGSTFIGTANGDLYVLPKGESSPFLYPIDNARKIKAMVTNANYIFVGSRQGLHILSRDNFQVPFFGFISELELVNCTAPNCLIEQKSKNYWVRGDIRNVNDLQMTSNNTLLIATDYGIWELKIPEEAPIIAKKITDTPTQSVLLYHQEIWGGGKNGLSHYPISKTTTNKPSALSKIAFDMPINALAIDKKDNLWIGTDGYGVYFYNKKDITPLTKTQGDIVEKIVIDEQDDIWVATNLGVKKIVTNKDNQPLTRIYNVADGLPTKEINTLYSDKQAIYVGTNRGFTIVDKIKWSRNKIAPRVYLTNISINNKDNLPQKEFVLSYQENNLSIQFVGISYKSNRNVTYLYKMEGVDKTWHETKLTELSFRGLSARNYTFKIKAVDVEGKESNIKTITFTIKPPLWERLWFQLLLAAIISALIYTYLQNRIKNIEQRENEKAQAVQEKTALQLKVAEEHAEVERINNELMKSKLETLQAQMNPHFAYNALTSIQKFILTKDKRTANKYLVKFARLMRQFLEASKETYIPLDKEIELLQLYIEMEQLRFKEKFQVRYEIDPNVKAHEVPIPSMLLQVFVENAINHGLVYKEGNGWLTFKVKQVGEITHCIVEDDGIGRKKAAIIKKESAGAYKGLGMKISTERVKYLNMTEDVKVNILIEDDILGQDKGGTRITVAVDNQLVKNIFQ